MNRHSPRKGFSLIDAIVTLVMVGVLLALALPAIQVAREQSAPTRAATTCKNIALALQNYHDTYKVFPAGGMHAGTAGENERIGPAWWFGVLPFLEARQPVRQDSSHATSRAGRRAVQCPGDQRGPRSGTPGQLQAGLAALPRQSAARDGAGRRDRSPCPRTSGSPAAATSAKTRRTTKPLRERRRGSWDRKRNASTTTGPKGRRPRRHHDRQRHVAALPGAGDGRLARMARRIR